VVQPLRRGSGGCVRSGAWIDVFSWTPEDDRVLRGIEVVPDDLLDLGDEGRIATDRVRANEMRLEAIALQKIRDAPGAETDRLFPAAVSSSVYGPRAAATSHPGRTDAH
jgi:hypothetical protein